MADHSDSNGRDAVTMGSDAGFGRWSRVVLAVTFATILLLALASWRNYAELLKERQEATVAEGRRVLVAFEDHATRLFDYADGHLRAIRAAYIEHGAGERLRRHIREVEALHADSFFGIIYITDRDGQRVFNSDSAHYGGSNVGNIGEVHTREGLVPELSLTIPPLAAIFLVPES